MKIPLESTIKKIANDNPLLLAHHPTCEYYSHHVINIRGIKLCMGCFIVYPIGLLSLTTLVSLRMTIFRVEMMLIPTALLYILGFSLLSPKLLMKIAPGNQKRMIRVMTKALLAIGLALIAYPFIFRPTQRIKTTILFVGFLFPYVGYKALTATDDCQGCPEADDFPNCSGMSFDGTYTYKEENSNINNNDD
jgi:hypothetical protein